MAERIPLSKLAHFTRRTDASLRTYLQVGSFDESHADENAPPICDVGLVQAIELRVVSDLMRMCAARTVRLTKRVMREFSRSVDMDSLSYRLTAMAHSHPGQGFACDDIGVTSSGFVVLDLAEIVRRVFEVQKGAT